MIARASRLSFRADTGFLVTRRMEIARRLRLDIECRMSGEPLPHRLDARGGGTSIGRGRRGAGQVDAHDLDAAASRRCHRLS